MQRFDWLNALNHSILVGSEIFSQVTMSTGVCGWVGVWEGSRYNTCRGFSEW